MNRFALLSVLFSTLFLNGCISSETKSYTDPDYKTAIFDRVIVNLNSLPGIAKVDAEKGVLQALKEAGISAVMISEILPPTRDFNVEQAKELVAQSGYDYMIALSMTGSDSSSTLASIYSTTYGTGTVNGNRIKGNAQTVSTPITIVEGKTSLDATIFDVKGERKAWSGSILTKADGTAFVGNFEAIGRSAMQSILDTLKAEGHLPTAVQAAK